MPFCCAGGREVTRPWCILFRSPQILVLEATNVKVVPPTSPSTWGEGGERRKVWWWLIAPVTVQSSSSSSPHPPPPPLSLRELQSCLSCCHPGQRGLPDNNKDNKGGASGKGREDDNTSPALALAPGASLPRSPGGGVQRPCANLWWSLPFY